MPCYTFAEIAAAVDRLTARLETPIDARFQAEYEAGHHPNLLAHERIGPGGVAVPLLVRHLTAALSAVHQPSTYYDIFRACRAVNFVLRLDAGLRVLDEKQAGHLDDRLDRLRRADQHDAFDSVLFEILTAAKYAALPGTERVTFIRETQEKTPDLLVVQEGRRSFVECKKSERIREHAMDSRNVVRDLLGPILAGFREQRISVAGDIVFHVDPAGVDRAALALACGDALLAGTVILGPHYTVTIRRLGPMAAEEFPCLYPSPLFHFARYGYRIRSEWFGLVNAIEAGFADCTRTPPGLGGGASTWLSGMDWDGGIKWRIDQEDVVSRYRRFAFNTVFKGLSQLKAQREDTTLHLWLESDYFMGGRRDVLLDLFQRLKASQRDLFSWVIVNETLLDISPRGYFDLIEHAHPIKGPTAAGEARAMSVFTEGDEGEGPGEFGVGHPLPDIDAIS